MSQSSMRTDTNYYGAPSSRGRTWQNLALTVLVSAAAAIVLAVLGWQGITAGGNPDPLTEGISERAAVMNTGIVVFREGLEAVLVLAALTASMVRRKQQFWKPIALGAALSFVASVATWFVVVALIDSVNAPALHVQAATGVVAIVVLLVIMNWFFHKIYWTGWIVAHEKRKRAIIEAPHDGPSALSDRRVFWGLLLVGLTAVYREGFEVVLFLQNLRSASGRRPCADRNPNWSCSYRLSRLPNLCRPAAASIPAIADRHRHHDWRRALSNGGRKRPDPAAGWLDFDNTTLVGLSRLDRRVVRHLSKR